MTATIVPDQSTRALGERWALALNDLDQFAEMCSDDCQVWHSTDNAWVSVPQAVEDARRRAGDIPPQFEARGVTYTENGFFNQCYIAIDLAGQPMRLHLVQLVDVKDGKAVRVQEYVGPEMPVD
ncbi:hypothetical protein GOARA_056_00860 [Gordonia araii NBRC 100433]|uniref:SnoaL-like domain-containing protein n=1 Tax=Gordonia araii NBRC 100433 TaxID=1073574 RepID=G7H3B4_9ACTN|nr:hypothetical protein [Gordonia araii]NNG96458.1 hypothetical protein [Gordonia araii NBRC 100433]GAB10339.1 hypothetical protein GOARA_056_00860 [Gordonia araii NBRC 100433]